MTNPADQHDAATATEQIATLPPLPVLTNEIRTSPRTGEPHRPVMAVIALVAFLLAALGVAVTYGLHWWAAANPGNYANSARLIEWVEPPPGKWLALTLEGALAAMAALVAAACGIAGVQSWNGRRWSRWAGVVALALTGGLVALFDWSGIAAASLALIGAVLLFLPPMARFFREFATLRSARPSPYRRPERIFYGRLPRFR